MLSIKERLNIIKETEITNTKVASSAIHDLIGVKSAFLFELKEMIEKTYPNISENKNPEGWFKIKDKIDNQIHNVGEAFVDSLFKEVYRMLETQTKTSKSFMGSDGAHALYESKFKEADELYKEDERIISDFKATLKWL